MQMSEIERLAREAASHLTRHQENTMTTPAPQSNLAVVEEFVGELRANSLIERLYTDRIGSRLDDSEIEHVVAIVNAFEKPRQPAETMAAPELPQRVPQPPAAPQVIA